MDHRRRVRRRRRVRTSGRDSPCPAARPLRRLQALLEPGVVPDERITTVMNRGAGSGPDHIGRTDRRACRTTGSVTLEGNGGDAPRQGAGGRDRAHRPRCPGRHRSDRRRAPRAGGRPARGRRGELFSRTTPSPTASASLRAPGAGTVELSGEVESYAARPGRRGRRAQHRTPACSGSRRTSRSFRASRNDVRLHGGRQAHPRRRPVDRRRERAGLERPRARDPDWLRRERRREDASRARRADGRAEGARRRRCCGSTPGRTTAPCRPSRR